MYIAELPDIEQNKTKIALKYGLYSSLTLQSNTVAS